MLRALVQANPLATWVVQGQGELLVNHIPFLLDPERGEHGMLIGHVARVNPVCKVLNTPTAPGVLVFQGPQAYISPNWYASKHEEGKVVPTWNYAVVHAHGVARSFDDPGRLLELVSRQSHTHEASQAQPWSVADAPAQYISKLLRAIIGIEVPVQRWVGTWKVSQNRSLPDRLSSIAGLKGQGSAQALAMAALIANTSLGD